MGSERSTHQGAWPSGARGVTASVSRLGAAMRAGVARVGVGEVLAAHRALAAVDAAREDEARDALRAVLCSRHDDLAVFDEAWRATFAGAARGDVLEELGAASLALPRVGDPDAGPEQGAVPSEPSPVPAAYSAVELLRDRDVAELTDAERAVVIAALRRLALRGPWRRSRRMVAAPCRGAGGRPDVRGTLRAAVRSGGEPLDRRWRTPGVVQRPLVLVCDVSGSMAPYARMLLALAHAAVASRRRVEAFALGTRLTRLTPLLRERDPDRAMARATEAIEDFSGGTRIGAAMAELTRRHGGRVGRGAVVVVLSDGWDRGEPELLASEMARLRRAAQRVIWLNPLIAAPGYEPLARGMAAALPYTDRFLPGHSLRSLEELVTLLDEGLEDRRA